MMLIAASWPSNRLAAVTKRSGVVSVCGALAGTCLAGELMATPDIVCLNRAILMGIGAKGLLRRMYRTVWRR